MLQSTIAMHMHTMPTKKCRNEKLWTIIVESFDLDLAIQARKAKKKMTKCKEGLEKN
jgi:hypothetical protein